MSLLFDRWNIGNLRAVETSLPDTATILRTTPSSTPGGWTQTYASVGTTPCRIVGLTPTGEVPAGAQLASITRWRLETLAGSGLHMTDRIQVTGLAGRTFEVIGDTEKSWNVTDTYYLAEVLRI